MLVLARDIGEQIEIDIPPSTDARTVIVTLVDVRHGNAGHICRLGIDAPKDITIDRQEVAMAKRMEKRLVALEPKIKAMTNAMR